MVRPDPIPAHAMRQRRRAGFTLIELLVVTLVLGVLAGIMVRRVDSVRERAHLSTIGQDFRNLGRAQERFFQLNFEYAVNLGDLDFSMSPGVQINVTEASVAGWAAVGTHQSLAGTRGCSIYTGTAAAPNLPNGQPLGVSPGIPGCTP